MEQTKYIKLFENNEEYEDFKNSPAFLLPNVSSIKDSGLFYNPIPEECVVIKYNIPHLIYIDDFPQWLIDDEYDGDADACKEDFLENSDDYDVDHYASNGEEFVYNGTTYYIWQYVGGDVNGVDYILTDRMDFTGEDLESDIHNDVCPFVCYLDKDLQVYVPKDGNKRILVKSRDYMDFTLDTTYFEYAIIDNDEVVYGGETYTLAMGKHTVKYKLKDSSVIPTNAFVRFNFIDDIKLPSSVRTIKTKSFQNCTFTTLVIPDGVETIEKEAFYLCNDFERIYVSKTVSSLSSDSFTFVKVKRIVVDEENETYDSREDCNAIIETATNELIHGCETTIIPDSVTSLGDAAFSNCKNLTEIELGSNITSYGDSLFNYCSNLKKITIDNNDIASADYDNLPLSRKGICSALYCSYVEEFVIGDNVTAIGNSFFNSCPNLKAIRIGKNVSSLGTYLLRSSHNIETIVIDNENQAYDSRDNCNAIIETATNQLLCGCKGTVIPNTVTSIGAFAFDINNGLTDIFIPSSVTDIAHTSFYKCVNVGTIVVDSNNPTYDSRDNCNAIITTNNSYILYGCKNTVLPNTLIGITARPFEYSSIQSIYIPSSVSSIGNGQFGNCPLLTTIVVDPDNHYYNSHDNCNAVIEGNKLICACKSTTIPSTVTTIGKSAFEMCALLTSITVPNNITTIEESAFCDCDQLHTVVLPDSVVSIGNDTFRGCSLLKSVTLPQTITSLPSACFAYCISLTNITVPSTVTEIGTQCFRYCESLQSITIPNGTTTLYSGVFEGCTSLRSITIPDSVQIISESAFKGCETLSTITIPSNVTQIGDWAFYMCTSLSDVRVLATTPPTLGTDVFEENFSNRRIYVPSESLEDYKTAWSQYVDDIYAQH